MPFLDRFDRLNRSISFKIQWVGFLGLLVMMVVTTIDVFFAKVFQSPIRGSLDTVELSQLVAISFGGAATLLRGKHVEVEFVTAKLPKSLQRILGVIVQILCLCLFALLVWRFAMHGYYLQEGGEVSATARIPVAPFVYAAALGILPLFLIYLKQIIESIRRVTGKWNQ